MDRRRQDASEPPGIDIEEGSGLELVARAAQLGYVFGEPDVSW
jgi:hypothetical protein